MLFFCSEYSFSYIDFAGTITVPYSSCTAQLPYLEYTCRNRLRVNFDVILLDSFTLGVFITFPKVDPAPEMASASDSFRGFLVYMLNLMDCLYCHVNLYISLWTKASFVAGCTYQYALTLNP